MNRYYCLPDEGTIARKKPDNPQFEEYNSETGKWEPNWELSGIYSGDIRSILCDTEQEANDVLQRYK